MDQKFINAIRRADSVLRIGYDTSVTHEAERTVVRYSPPGLQSVELELKPLSELYEGNDPFQGSDDDESIDRYLPLLTSVESAIAKHAREHTAVKDKQVIAILSRLVDDPEMRLKGVLCRAVQDQLRLCLSTNPYSKKEVVGALRKILKSAKRHHKADGPRGYVDFIQAMEL